MTTLKVPGRRDPGKIAAGPGTGGFLDAIVTDAIAVDAVRSGDVEPIALELDDDDVVEVQLEDGLSQWTSFGQLRADMSRQLERGTRAGELILPTRLSIGGPTRGGGDLLIQGLRVLKVDLPGQTARAVAAHIESKLETPGLCRWQPGQGRPVLLEEGAVPTDRPVLLFLHGTASRTTASFSGLGAPAQEPVRRQIEELYGEHVYAFEHRTLSESPIRNAIDLLEKLPKGVTLHIVSHSRGGLLGELLCRGDTVDRAPFDELDHKQFKGHPDAAALKKLSELLVEKRPHVERFVRVACPASGTTLASRRLDRYLSILVNLVGMIPALKGNPIYEFMTSFLLAVAKQRTDPSELPGLEAQMPESPLVRVLNRPGVRLDSDLCVVAGDIEGTGVFQRLGVLATDAFYCEDHDLVVNTRAMYGGAVRTRAYRFFFDRGSRIHHFSYFDNAASSRAVLAGLRGGSSDILKDIIDETGELAPERFRRRSATPQPVVFVLPGIMGSHLAADGNRIWLDMFDLALGRMSRIRIGSKSKVEPVRLVGSAYDNLCAFLADSHDVVPFPYDWRISLLDEAERLADAIVEKLDETDQPIRIIAHSMGGLLARAMIAKRPEVWKRLCARDRSRLIMLGTPNGGSWVIPRVLLGREKVIRQLAMLDFDHSITGLLEIVSRFRGMLELLPANEPDDMFDEPIWSKFADASDRSWVLPAKADLDAAREFRKVIDKGPVDAVHMLYVAGVAPATPIGYEITTSKSGRAALEFTGTARGDGRVPWSTGILPGLDVWYMPAEHGEMAAHRPAFAAILDLLESGDTTRLGRQPIVARGITRGPGGTIPDRFPMPEPDPDMFPDRNELEASALGFEQQLEAQPLVHNVRVSVSHGDLAFARYAVAVGHYEGDTIVSAERALDTHLDGRMSELYRVGLYPGPIKTCEVVLNHEGRKPGGAIIVGLGRIGDLSAGLLTTTYAQACLRYATIAGERESAKTETAPVTEIELTTLLVGTGEGGLRVEDAIRAMLVAVENANRKLADRPSGTPIRIAGIEIIELYEDRAVQAARTLQRLSADNVIAGFIVDPIVRSVRGGRSRVFYNEDPRWWRPLQIQGAPPEKDELRREMVALRQDLDAVRSSQSDGKAGSDAHNRSGVRVTDPGMTGLRFMALADRARAEVSSSSSQRRLVDRMVQSAMSSTAHDSDLGQAMYELLVPNALKRQAPEQRNLLVIVDEEAAAYPWELLEDPMLPDPIAIGSGVIRQLFTEQYREQVISPTENRALVVGDPLTHFEDLPAARTEAEAVAGLLDSLGRFDVDSLIGKGANDILKALFSRRGEASFGYKILHLAGHGVYREGGDEVTGMVIGPDSYLTPGDIEQLRQVPELVFLNCCYLGRIESPKVRANRNRLAANLGTQLIRMGVRAVVAAGWAVNDSAAATFADQFYRSMLGGQEFGEAVLRARRETFRLHRSLNTWGAFQCYGDPGYTLRAQSDGGGASSHGFVAATEAIVELRNIARDADTTAVHGDEWLRKRLEAVVQELRKEWLEQGEMQAWIGEAYGQLDQFPRAIEYFTAAMSAEAAYQPVRSIERLLNFEARSAATRWALSAKSPEDRKEASSAIRHAIDRIEKLIAIGETSERRSVLASAFKRLAYVSAGAERRDAFARATEEYRKAHEIMQHRAGRVNHLPLINWLACLAVKRWREGWSAGDRQTLQTGLELARKSIHDLEHDRPGFFHGAASSECDLVEHVGEGDLHRFVDAIVDDYVLAWRRGASRRQLRSTTDNFRLLATLLRLDAKADAKNIADASEKRRTTCQRIADSLTQIADRIAAATSPEDGTTGT